MVVKTNSAQSGHHSLQDGENGVMIFKKLSFLLLNLPGGRRLGRDILLKFRSINRACQTILPDNVLGGKILAIVLDVEAPGWVGLVLLAAEGKESAEAQGRGALWAQPWASPASASSITPPCLIGAWARACGG